MRGITDTARGAFRSDFSRQQPSKTTGVTCVVMAIFLSVTTVGYAGELSLQPVSATGDYLIEGDQIYLRGGAQEVTLELRVSGWSPAQLGTYAARIDSTGYGNGVGGALVPKGWPGSPKDGVSIDGTHPAFVFSGMMYLPAWDVTTLNYIIAATLMGGGGAVDGGQEYYGGTLVLSVPGNAEGTYTIDILVDQNTFMSDTSGMPITPVIRVPAVITIGLPLHVKFSQPPMCDCIGDTNDDGIVAVEDWTAVLDCIDGDCSRCVNSCDVNCDGIVNVADADAAICIFQGLPQEQCCPLHLEYGEDVPSNVDVTDLDPNIVVADDFVSDGRPINAVRWWGSDLKPPCEKPAPAGEDCWTTLCDGTTFYEFGGAGGYPPIPADFFGPGSDPFSGVIALGGVSGVIDTTVARLEDMCFEGELPASDMTPIELVQLDLASCDPITVTYNGGMDPEQWDVATFLDGPQPPGMLLATKLNPDGGTFNSDLFVQAGFQFVPVTGSGSVQTMGAAEVGIIPLRALGLSWVQTAPVGALCGNGGFYPGYDKGSDTCCPESCHDGPEPGHQHCVTPPECPKCVGKSCPNPNQCAGCGGDPNCLCGLRPDGTGDCLRLNGAAGAPGCDQELEPDLYCETLFAPGYKCFNDPCIGGAFCARNCETFTDPSVATDDCLDKPTVNEGSYPVSTVGATVDGPPLVCGGPSPDVWLNYVATCDGTATVDMCGGANYDSVLEVMGGCSCSPTDPVVACNDDTCGRLPRVSFPVTAGECFKVHIGGYSGTTGSGIVTITCEPDPVCTKDKAITIQTCSDAPLKWTGNTVGAGDDSTCRSSEDLVISVDILEQGEYTFDLCVNLPNPDLCWDSYMYLVTGPDPCACEGVIAENDDHASACSVCPKLSLIGPVNLDPGKYWIVIEGTGGPLVDAGWVDLHVTSNCKCSKPAPAGDDCWTTPCDGSTYVDFSGTGDVPPIPADYFGPGTDPFEGIIAFGDPMRASMIDTVVTRHDDMCLDGALPDVDTTSIELVQLDLLSCAPVTITENGGMPFGQFDVWMRLDGPQMIGVLTATKVNAGGGVFDSDLSAAVELEFTPVGGGPGFILSSAEMGGPLDLSARDAPWIQTPPPQAACPSPGFYPGQDKSTDVCCPPVCHAGPAPGHEHCVVPPECPPCEPNKGCDTPHQCLECIPGNPDCVCVGRPSGSSACGDLATYSGIDCLSDAECPPGDKCFVDDCMFTAPGMGWCGRNCDPVADEKFCPDPGVCSPCGTGPDCFCALHPDDGLGNCVNMSGSDPFPCQTDMDCEMLMGSPEAKCFDDPCLGPGFCAYNCGAGAGKECNNWGNCEMCNGNMDCSCALRPDGSVGNCVDLQNMVPFPCHDDSECAGVFTSGYKCFDDPCWGQFCAPNCPGSGEKACGNPGECFMCNDNPSCSCALHMPDGAGYCANLDLGQTGPCIDDMECDMLFGPGYKCFDDPCLGPFCAPNCLGSSEKACGNPEMCDTCNSDGNQDCACATSWPDGFGECFDIYSFFPGTGCADDIDCEGMIGPGYKCFYDQCIDPGGMPFCAMNCPGTPPAGTLLAKPDPDVAASKVHPIALPRKVFALKGASSRVVGGDAVEAAGVPQLNFDGWYISFHEPPNPEPVQTQPLGLYFCETDAVAILPTALPACDGHPVIEYVVNLADCCLVHAGQDSRTGLVPATKEGFYEEKCGEYNIDIEAVVGHTYFQDPATLECIEVDTGNTKDADFWGWHTTPINQGLRDAVETTIKFGPAGEHLFASWNPITPICSAPNMAFELLTTVPATADPDPNGNGIPDQCECLPSSVPEVIVLFDPAAPSVPLELTTNRFLVFTAGDAGQNQAIRVTFMSLPRPFDLWNGSQLWVGPTSLVSEVGANVLPTEGFPNFNAATLQCTPLYTDWSSLGTINVFHEGIVPNGDYRVEVVDETCDENDKANFSIPLDMTTAVWGDTVFDLSLDPPLPPGGPPVAVSDALAVLERFSSLSTAIVKARADLEPGCLDLTVNVSDVLASLSGFSGLNYPFVQTATDPCDSTCPSVLP